MRSILLALVLISFATPALASDGILEINQTCAVQTGCFAGDTAGFPVTISSLAGRSYRLTGDLQFSELSTIGIEITSGLVTLDFNGFRLKGDPGTGVIQTGVQGSLTSFIVVTNGLIEDVDGPCISLGDNARVEDMTLAGCGSGIEVGQYSIVNKNTVSGVGGNGIVTANGSTVSGNIVSSCGGIGIDTLFGSTVSSNTVSSCGGNGISTGGSSTVSGNTVLLNGGDGISAGASTVSGNTVSNNGGNGIDGVILSTITGNTVYFNGDATDPELNIGIECSSGSCTVHGNTVGGSSGFGLNLGSGSGYRENVVAGQVSGGVDAGANVINGVVTPTP